jgi:hypothetical protein
MEIMNTEEYAKLRGISQQAVRQAISNQYRLPGVRKIIKTGKYWILKVDVNATELQKEILDN